MFKVVEEPTPALKELGEVYDNLADYYETQANAYCYWLTNEPPTPDVEVVTPAPQPSVAVETANGKSARGRSKARPATNLASRGHVNGPSPNDR